MEVGAVANTTAAKRALEAYRALQRRAPQPDAAPQHSFEVRLPSVAHAVLLRGWPPQLPCETNQRPMAPSGMARFGSDAVVNAPAHEVSEGNDICIG